MMLALFTILATLSISTENGVHIRADESGVPIPTSGGSELYVGAMYQAEILGARVVASNNANTVFDVVLTVPHRHTLRPHATVLVANGVGFAQVSSGTSGMGADRMTTMNFQIDGRTYAETIAQHFDIEPQLRHHPGYQLHVLFEQTGGTSAQMRIENVGASAFSFIRGGSNRGTRDNQFSFSATREGSSVPTLTMHDFGGLAGVSTLEPGEVHQQTVDLTNWFDLEPGDYQVLGSYSMRFVEPSVNTFNPVWVDYATASFTLRVE